MLTEAKRVSMSSLIPRKEVSTYLKETTIYLWPSGQSFITLTAPCDMIPTKALDCGEM
jgi:hypothetical protein